MNRVVLSIIGCLSLFGSSSMKAQTEVGNESMVKPRTNIIKLNYGPGLVTSKIVSYRTTYKNVNVMSLSADYEHIWPSGFGFGINASQNYIHKTSNNVFYVGASFVAQYVTTEGWRWEGALGLGYAANDFDVEDSTNGIGIFQVAGVSYQLTKHWGLGLELRLLNSRYEKPKGWDTENYGVNMLNLSLGLRYQF